MVHAKHRKQRCMPAGLLSLCGALLCTGVCGASPAGFTAGPEFLVNEFSTGDQWLISAIELDDGDALLTWNSSHVTPTATYARVVAENVGPTGADAQVGPFPNMDVAPLSGAGCLAVWRESSSVDGSYEIWAQAHSGVGIPSGPRIFLYSHALSGPTEVSAATSGLDRFWVASRTEVLVGQAFDLCGRQLAPLQRICVNFPTSDRYPEVVSHSNGFLVVWQGTDQSPSAEEISARPFGLDGYPAGPASELTLVTASGQEDPAVALGASGGLVAWTSWIGAGSSQDIIVRAVTFAGVGAGAETTANEYRLDKQTNPSVAALSDSDFVVAWESFEQDGSDHGVFASLFNSAGTPLGPEFTVNEVTAGNQWNARIAAFPDGGFFIAWQTAPAPGDPHDIKARIFRPQPIATKFSTSGRLKARY